MNNNQSKDYSLVNDTFQGQTKRILKQISQINLTCISKSQSRLAIYKAWNMTTEDKSS